MTVQTTSAGKTYSVVVVGAHTSYQLGSVVDNSVHTSSILLVATGILPTSPSHGSF